MKKNLLVAFLAFHFILTSKNVQGQSLSLYGSCPEDKIMIDKNGNTTCSTTVCISPECDPDIYNDIKELLKGIPGASTKPHNTEDSFYLKILNPLKITIQNLKKEFFFVITKKDLSKGKTISLYQRRLFQQSKKVYFSARKENATFNKKLIKNYQKKASDNLQQKIIAQIFDQLDIKYKTK
jgi:hypothetical protein